MRIISTLFVVGLALPTIALSGCAKPAADAPAQSPTTTAATPPPSRMGGCRDLHLYAANDEGTQVVVVDVDARSVGLEKGQKKAFDLASAPNGVKVWLDVYLQPAHVENVHCTKSPTEAQMAERYAATAGTLTIELAADGTVTASVDGAKFALDGRPTIEVAGARFDRIKVARSSG
jgi:hypothetical protein